MEMQLAAFSSTLRTTHAFRRFLHRRTHLHHSPQWRLQWALETILWHEKYRQDRKKTTEDRTHSADSCIACALPRSRLNPDPRDLFIARSNGAKVREKSRMAKIHLCSLLLLACCNGLLLPPPSWGSHKVCLEVRLYSDTKLPTCPALLQLAQINSNTEDTEGGR